METALIVLAILELPGPPIEKGLCILLSAPTPDHPRHDQPTDHELHDLQGVSSLSNI